MINSISKSFLTRAPFELSRAHRTHEIWRTIWRIRALLLADATLAFFNSKVFTEKPRLLHQATYGRNKLSMKSFDYLNLGPQKTILWYSRELLDAPWSVKLWSHYRIAPKKLKPFLVLFFDHRNILQVQSFDNQNFDLVQWLSAR